MALQIRALSTPYPNVFTQSKHEFDDAASRFSTELPLIASDLNRVATEVEVNALRAEVAVDSLPAGIWVTGTTYAIGDVVFSPIDHFNYRRKTTGAGSTDPSVDSTNWALLTKTGAGGSDTTSSAVDIALSATSGRLQVISMTDANKKVTAPAATGLTKGSSIFVIKNNGQYRFSFHKNGGAFICYVQPGQIISASCSDISTAAGIWHVSGQNIEAVYDGNTREVLNAVDSRNIAVAMLSSTKAICVFRNNSTGFLWGVVLNYGSASGTPAAINGVASSSISIAAQTSSQATVVFKTATGATEGYVLDVSGNTITPGTIAHIDTATGGVGTGVTALSSTKLLCVYFAVSGSGQLRERVLDIASSVITPSAEVNADSSPSSNIVSTRREVLAVSSAKAIVGFKTVSGTSVTLRLQSISGSTPAPTGSDLAVPDYGGVSAIAFCLVVLSTDRAVLIQTASLTYTDFMFSLLDISGTTPILLCRKKVRMNLIDDAYLRAVKLDSNSIFMTWSGGGSGGADTATIRITSGDRILVGNICEKVEPGVAVSEAYVACAALDSTHVMHVCRNASTFLSAKTLEVIA